MGADHTNTDELRSLVFIPQQKQVIAEICTEERHAVIYVLKKISVVTVKNEPQSARQKQRGQLGDYSII